MSKFASKFAVLQDECASNSSEDETKTNKNSQRINLKPPHNKTSNGQEKKKRKPRKKNALSDSATADVWDSWVKKDKEMVEKQYVEELSTALLVSSIESYSHSNAAFSDSPKVQDLEVLEEEAQRKSARVLQLEKEHQMNKERLKIEQEVSSRFQSLLNEKDKLIQDKEMRMQTLQDDLARERAENERLKKLLSSGEGRSTEELCEELTNLTQIISELTAQIHSLNSQLEREKSRSRQLATEMLRLRHA